MRPPLLIPVAIATLVAASAVSRSAAADASAWVFAGGGALAWKQGEDSLSTQGALCFDLGVGTTPDASFIIGGLFRITPIVGSGTDLGLLARAATRGFQTGSFGLAVDAGGYARFWGAGSLGFTASITAGLPLGFSLSFHTMAGSGDLQAFGAVAGVDLLRLVLYRQSLLNWWPNPSPPQHTAAPRALWSF